jgi:hypothetical protein
MRLWGWLGDFIDYVGAVLGGAWQTFSVGTVATLLAWLGDHYVQHFPGGPALWLVLGGVTLVVTPFNLNRQNLVDKRSAVAERNVLSEPPRVS